MKKLITLALLVLTPPLPAQDRDPLSDVEVEQLREATDNPEKRFKLLMDFIRVRMAAIEQLRSDPKLAATRGKDIHKLLEDFNTLTEELEDNLDMYRRRRSDMRKPLKLLVEAYSEWQLKLRTLKETTPPAEVKQFEFVLQSAHDILNDGQATARELLQAQLQAAEDKKKK
jgi:hypothetical protein